MSRQKQMTNDHAFFHHTTLIKFRSSDLLHHFFQSILCNLRIVWCMRIFSGQFRIHVFEIRQINVYQTFQYFQSVRFFISTTVINNRYLQPMRSGIFQRQCNLWQKMTCCYQINIIRTLSLQLKKKFCKIFHSNLFPGLSSGYLIILTKSTPK